MNQVTEGLLQESNEFREVCYVKSLSEHLLYKGRR